MPEHIVCFIRIPASQEKVDEIEAANPDTMEGIITPAIKYIKRHVRAVADGVVIEVDEYASREDYDAFMVEARPALARYDELIGESVSHEAFVVLRDESFEGDKWFSGQPVQ